MLWLGTYVLTLLGGTSNYSFFSDFSLYDHFYGDTHEPACLIVRLFNARFVGQVKTSDEISLVRLSS